MGGPVVVHPRPPEAKSGGTADALFLDMVMLLVLWVVTSVVFCLAFLGVAARRVPRINEPVTVGTEADLPDQEHVAASSASLASQLS